MNEYTPPPDRDIAASLGLTERHRRSRRWLWPIAALVALAALAGGWWWLAHRGALSYVMQDATRGPLTVTVSATGTLAPETQVDVGAEISGRVDSVNVDYNEHVSKGEVLATINTDQIRAQLAQSQAALNAARATVTNDQATVTQTKLKRDRYQDLFQRGIVARQDLESADADYQRAVAAVAKARADVANAAAQVKNQETLLGKATVRSPIDGVVIDRKVNPGQTVAASFQTPVLFTLASDLSRMQLDVDIDEADIGLVHARQSATFTVDAYPQRTFEATLIEVRNAAQVVNGVVTYQGVLAVDNKEGLLRPGLTATVDILVASVKNTLLVPNGALRFTPPAQTPPPLPPAKNGVMHGRVWVLRNDRPVALDLTIGLTNGQMTQVLGGNLKPDEPVITDTTQRANAP
jgi:HlyD family secretion protein